MSGILTRDDIIDGVGEVITLLRDSGTRATLRIVGGAAIALTIDGARGRLASARPTAPA
jgi:hypothetical protein